MNMYTPFETIEAGAEVLLNFRNGEPRIVKVARTTKSQIIIGEQDAERKYRRKDGQEVGLGDAYFSTSLSPYRKEEYDARQNFLSAESAQRRAKRTLASVTEAFQHNPNTDTKTALDEAYAALEDARAAVTETYEAYKAARAKNP